MTEVVSVRFKNKGKLYFFSPNGLDISDSSTVVVETAKGLELGECAYGNHWVTDERIVPPLRPVIRAATAADLRVAEVNKLREKEAFEICQKKIADHKLEMKLVDVECNFEGNKIVFFFASEGRVDFRELVKDLAGVFRTRIELRQIGVRDEAKMLGGIGICGRAFCCHQFLDDFLPVSTKMAKMQSMSLNPAKISGSCGRLMCCLRYEQEAYEELVKNVPKNGAFVQTTGGYGNVTQINLLRQKIKVRIDGAEQVIKTFDVDEVATVPGGRPKPGEPLPSVLKYVPKKVVEEEQMPELVYNSAPAARQAPPPHSPKPQRQEPRHDAEKPENGAKKPNSRRRTRPRKHKPADKDSAQNTAKPTESANVKAPKQAEPAKPNKQQAEKKPRQDKPVEEGNTQKRNVGHRRRYYPRKPKSSGGAKNNE